jgi:hypothetical protein
VALEGTTRVGVHDEWHVVSRKRLCRNDIGEKGLACLDGFITNPSLARRPFDAMF